MKSRIAKLTMLLGVAALAAGPGRVQAQVTPEEHANHHPGGQAADQAPPPATPTPAKGMAGTKGPNMKAADARLDELVAKRTPRTVRPRWMRLPRSSPPWSSGIRRCTET